MSQTLISRKDLESTKDQMPNIEVLSKLHDRSSFDCGVESLNDFIKKYAFQYQKKNICQVFVTTIASKVTGFYTLSPKSINISVLPKKEAKKLPKHPVLVIHLGRLAVCESVKGKGLGEFLLMDAIARVLKVSQDIGAYALEVVAINEKAASFYGRYGFQSLQDDMLHMFLSIKTIRKLPLL